MDKEALLRLKERGEAVLIRFFELANGNISYMVTFGKAIDEWGWTDEECVQAEDYLVGKNYIKRQTFGETRTASFSITRLGWNQAEQLILNETTIVERNRINQQPLPTAQQAGNVNFGSINGVGDVNINLPQMVGHDKSTTTISVTITHQTSSVAVNTDLVSTILIDKPSAREIRLFDSFLFFALPDGFTQWWTGYVASIGENRIYPSLVRIYENDEFHEYGNRRWVYTYCDCEISFIMKVEKAETLRITPIAKASIVAIDIRRSSLNNCEKHITNVVCAAKSKFSEVKGIATEISSNATRITLAQFNKSLREILSESDLQDFCLALRVDYESLPGNSKADKTRGLILELQRRGRVPHLLTLVKQERPHIPWPDTISD